MKTQSLLVLFAAANMVTVACAQRGALQQEPPPSAPRRTDPPPNVWTNPDYRNPWVNPAPAQPQPANPQVYDQKLWGGATPLVTQEQAQTIIDRFKEVYPKLGSPRFLIYVNRELVDEQSGMKLIKRDERIESSRSAGNTNDSAVRSTVDNTYRSDGKTAPTLADKQTVRDVERLFGRPLRFAGASLADQRVATQLIADRPLSDFIGSTDTPQARRDRAALSQIADAVIEVLISSRSIPVTTVSGTRTVTIPDIQATCISLKDSKILGQASSSEITGRVPSAQLGRIGVNEVTEATALQLMEDMGL